MREKIQQRLQSFVQLGKIMKSVSDESHESQILDPDEHDAFQTLIQNVRSFNGWFTEENVRKQLVSLAAMLESTELTTWMNRYYSQPTSEKKIAIVMAGNIPLVGFHDLLCVLMSGYNTLIKMSSDDQHLLPALLDLWKHSHPEMVSKIEFTKGQLQDFEAVIATGSNNSARYFQQYFGEYPNIIRKNRTSVAVLTGNESKETLEALGEDVFTYFGLGCRNVTKVYLPEGFDKNRLFEAFYKFKWIIDHNKYANNYDYHKAIWLMNQDQLLENGFMMLKEDSKFLVSPIGSLFYEEYRNKEELLSVLEDRKEEIQCIVGDGFVPFGQAQKPKLWDYADGVDTMKFLNSLS